MNTLIVSIFLGFFVPNFPNLEPIKIKPQIYSVCEERHCVQTKTYIDENGRVLYPPVQDKDVPKYFEDRGIKFTIRIQSGS